MEGKKPLTGKLTFNEVGTWQKWSEGKWRPEDRAAIEKVLQKNDRLVRLRIAINDKGELAEVVALVAWRDDEPRLVGHWVHYFTEFPRPKESGKTDKIK